MDLSLIAADVAQALELRNLMASNHWASLDFRKTLEYDGSNLTDPYWFMRCCEWLWDRGSLLFSNDDIGEPDRPNCYTLLRPMLSNISVNYCPLALAPAALVSAVWRKQQEKQNG